MRELRSEARRELQFLQSLAHLVASSLSTWPYPWRYWSHGCTLLGSDLQRSFGCGAAYLRFIAADWRYPPRQGPPCVGDFKEQLRWTRFRVSGSRWGSEVSVRHSESWAGLACSCGPCPRGVSARCPGQTNQGRYTAS